MGCTEAHSPHGPENSPSHTLQHKHSALRAATPPRSRAGPRAGSGNVRATGCQHSAADGSGDGYIPLAIPFQKRVSTAQSFTKPMVKSRPRARLVQRGEAQPLGIVLASQIPFLVTSESITTTLVTAGTAHVPLNPA